MNVKERLTRDRERAILERHEHLSRIGDYFGVPDMRGVSAELALLDLERLEREKKP